jgi:ribonucleoside-diphosphate reductase alpha chain
MGDNDRQEPPRYRLPDERSGRTSTLVIHSGDKVHSYDVTVGYYPDGEIGELFVRQEREGGTVGALLDAVATAISIGLQYGIPWKVFASKFAHTTFAPRGITDDEDHTLRFVSSPLDYLARYVSSRQRSNGGENEDG